MQVEPKQEIWLPGQVHPLPVEASKLRIQKNHIAYQSDGLVTRQPGVRLTKQMPDGSIILGVSTISHLYSPEIGDFVIGIVRWRTQGSYMLDINSGQEGILNQLAFNGATKRNRPNLQVGSCIFCKVQETPPYLNPRLTCITTEKKEWTTGENKLGELKKGTLAYVPANRHAYLQNFLNQIGKHVSFDVAMGKNGIVWLNSNRTKHLLTLSNLVQSATNNIQHLMPLIPQLFDR